MALKYLLKVKSMLGSSHHQEMTGEDVDTSFLPHLVLTR